MAHNFNDNYKWKPISKKHKAKRHFIGCCVPYCFGRLLRKLIFEILLCQPADPYEHAAEVCEELRDQRDFGKDCFYDQYPVSKLTPIEEKKKIDNVITFLMDKPPNWLYLASTEINELSALKTPFKFQPSLRPTVYPMDNKASRESAFQNMIGEMDSAIHKTPAGLENLIVNIVVLMSVNKTSDPLRFISDYLQYLLALRTSGFITPPFEELRIKPSTLPSSVGLKITPNASLQIPPTLNTLPAKGKKWVIEGIDPNGNIGRGTICVKHETSNTPGNESQCGPNARVLKSISNSPTTGFEPGQNPGFVLVQMTFEQYQDHAKNDCATSSELPYIVWTTCPIPQPCCKNLRNAINCKKLKNALTFKMKSGPLNKFCKCRSEKLINKHNNDTPRYEKVIDTNDTDTPQYDEIAKDIVANAINKALVVAQSNTWISE